MNSMEQVKENIKIASDTQANSLTADDKNMFKEVKNTFKQRIKIGCTACGYCMPCPAGVNIPKCFEYYNNYHMYGNDEFYYYMSEDQRASKCIECGKCETHCPQALPIKETLKKVKAVFESEK
jgi:predicted aldo/keto reductase-like oxidoreductase